MRLLRIGRSSLVPWSLVTCAYLFFSSLPSGVLTNLLDIPVIRYEPFLPLPFVRKSALDFVQNASAPENGKCLAVL